MKRFFLPLGSCSPPLSLLFDEWDSLASASLSDVHKASVPARLKKKKKMYITSSYFRPSFLPSNLVLTFPPLSRISFRLLPSLFSPITFFIPIPPPTSKFRERVQVSRLKSGQLGIPTVRSYKRRKRHSKVYSYVVIPYRRNVA